MTHRTRASAPATRSSPRRRRFASASTAPLRGSIARRPERLGLHRASRDIPGIASHDQSTYAPLRQGVHRSARRARPRTHSSILAYRLGPLIEDLGQIVIPTGLIEVAQIAPERRSERRPRREDVRRCSAGQRLIPLRHERGRRARTRRAGHERKRRAQFAGSSTSRCSRACRTTS